MPRPKLPPETQANIEAAIEAFLAARPLEKLIAPIRNSLASSGGDPPRPQRARVKLAFQEYACRLFDCEAQFYPKHARNEGELHLWLIELMACISDDVGTAVDLYSRQTFFSFDFHCNGSERIEAVFEALEPRIEYWLKVAREPSPSIKDTEQLTIPDASRPETIGAQINRLRQESQLTIEQLAEEVDVNRRTVERHLADDSRPYDRHLSAYGRVFSKCLNRKVVIRKMP